MSTPIVVTGATGNTGRHVVAGLRAEGAEVRTATRATTPPVAGIDHALFDWADPSTYRSALTGVERVYLVAPVGVIDPTEQVTQFLSVARSVGVRRVVFLSSAVIPPTAPGLDRARLAAQSMSEWAMLRPSWFLQNLLVPEHHLARGLRERGELISATDGRGIGFVDAADIAAVGVRALLDDRPNREYVVTGPEVLSYDDLADILTEVLAPARAVRHVRLDPAELARQIEAAGAPAGLAEVLADAERFIAVGVEERVTSTVAEVTGRQPRSARAFVTAHRQAITAGWELAGGVSAAGPSVTEWRR